MSEEFEQIDDEVVEESSEVSSIAASIREAMEEVPDDEVASATIDEAPVADEISEPVEEETPASNELVVAPISWPASEKERFKSLPPEVQKFISKREQERDSFLSSKANEVAEIKKYVSQYADIDQAFAPFERKMQLSGANRGQVISQLLGAQKYLDENPPEAIRWLAESYGLTPEQIFNAEASTPRVDPQTANLQRKIEQLEGYLQQQKQTQHQSAYQAINNDIAAFASETDGQGNYLRPHFNEVYTDMEAIVRHLRSNQPNLPIKEVLQQAYDRAVWANPNSREAMLLREKQKVQANHMNEAKRKAEKARVLGSSVTGAPTSNASPAISGNLREMLESAISRHYQ